MKNLGSKKIETERLILRKFTLNDVDGMYNNWATDKECCRTLSWDLHTSVDVTKDIVSNWVSKYENDFYFNWVIELKNTNEIIGNIEVVKGVVKDEFCEIGYCLGSKYWNNGYGTESLKAVLCFLLTKVGFRIVEAIHISENPASGRIMKKSGMIKEATLRKRRINKNTKNVNDLVIYSITKEELI